MPRFEPSMTMIIASPPLKTPSFHQRLRTIDLPASCPFGKKNPQTSRRTDLFPGIFLHHVPSGTPRLPPRPPPPIVFKTSSTCGTNGERASNKPKPLPFTRARIATANPNPYTLLEIFLQSSAQAKAFISRNSVLIRPTQASAPSTSRKAFNARDHLL